MEFVSGNIFIREMHFPLAGNVVEGHKHNFDHTTYLVRGAILIECLNDDEVLSEDGAVLTPATTKLAVVKRAHMPGKWVLIKAGVKHRLTALEDDSMGHCIYSHRNPQGEIVQEYDGWAPGVL